jgi:acetyl esterase
VTLDSRVREHVLRSGTAAAYFNDHLPLFVVRAGYNLLGVVDALRLGAAVRSRDLRVGAVPARLYSPAALSAGAPAPLIFFLHGGGFAIGGLDSHHSACQALAAGSGMRVLSLAYALAPERPHPAAHEDAWSAYARVSAAPAEFGLAPSAPRVVLAGDSAGGLLALVLALRIRDHNRAAAAAPRAAPVTAVPVIAPAALVPFYPAVDPSVLRPSRHKYASGFVLSESMYRGFGSLMLGRDKAARARWADDPRLHPLTRTADWRGLPATVVVTAEHDILHDEGVALVDAMRAGGAAAEHVEGRGLIHGFVTETGAFPAAAQVVAAVAAKMRAAVEGQ